MQSPLQLAKESFIYKFELGLPASHSLRECWQGTLSPENIGFIYSIVRNSVNIHRKGSRGWNSTEVGDGGVGTSFWRKGQERKYGKWNIQRVDLEGDKIQTV